MIRLYGHMKGSFKTVTLGLHAAFEKLGVLDGVFLGEDSGLEDVPGGADSAIAVVCGDPMRVLQAHYHGQHAQQLLMIAPNSEGLPTGLVRQLKDVVKLASGEKKPIITGLLAPSRWAAEVLKREFPEHQVIHCPHGVLPEFKMDPMRRDLVRKMLLTGVFKLLHVTSSRLERKCTRELVLAWNRFKGQVELSQGSCLEILVNPTFFNEYNSFVKKSGVSDVLVVPGQNFEFSNYVAGIQNYNYVVQPSRAEGFGLVPLEASACGVPVIATACTGHSEYLPAPGAVIVRHGEEAPIDYMGAMAPTVSEEDILEGIEVAYLKAVEHHDEAIQYADEVVSNWTWEQKVAPAVEQMKELI